MDINLQRLDKKAIQPTYGSTGAAGFDLYAIEDVVIQPQQTAIIRTGWAMEIPEDMALMVYARSGISAKTTLRLANGVGVIDSDYRGELKILMFNSAAPNQHKIPECILLDGAKEEAYQYGYLPEGTCLIKKGERVAQCILHDITVAEFKEKALSKTTRGKGGMGSTGK